MKFRLYIVLVLTLLSVSACIVEPIGGGYRGGYHGGGHDDGHRVWR